MNIRHCVSCFGKLIANIFRFFVSELIRNTIDGKILRINTVLFAKHISDTYCLKAHIGTAVTVAVDRKLCVAKFLCYALCNRYAVAHITLNIQGLFLVVIERRHIRIRQVVCRLHIDRRRIKHCGNECFRVTVDCRRRRSFAVGLRHIKDLFYIVGNSGCTVTLCIFNRFKNRNALSTFCDFDVVFAPIVKIFKLTCFGKLLKNEESVDRRVSVKTALCIEKRFELLRV